MPNVSYIWIRCHKSDFMSEKHPRQKFRYDQVWLLHSRYTAKDNLVTSVAQNLEILEKLTSLGGSTFLFGYIERKKYLKKNFENFATPPGSAKIYPMPYGGKKNFRKK